MSLVMPAMPQFSYDIEDLKATMPNAITEMLYEAAGGDAQVTIVEGGRRGGAKNALIAKAQAKHNRDPFYLNGDALGQVGALGAQILGGKRAGRGRLLLAIGKAMLESIKANVDAQRNPDGQPFRPLTLAYARRKQRQFGFQVPILRATGDLLSGLKVEITNQ